jgi:hypothetical protein
LVDPADVRLSPKSGGEADIPGPPLSANSALMHAAKTHRGCNALIDHLVGKGEELVWGLETTMLTHARLLSYASDSDDVEFRVFLANLECSLKFGRIAPSL